MKNMLDSLYRYTFNMPSAKVLKRYVCNSNRDDDGGNDHSDDNDKEKLF